MTLNRNLEKLEIKIVEILNYLEIVVEKIERSDGMKIFVWMLGIFATFCLGGLIYNCIINGI